MDNKFLVSIFVIVLVTFFSQAQTTTIPDANFENYLETHNANGGLVSLGDDTSLGDGIAGNNLVFTNRVDSVISLIINDLSIVNLDGIESFTALETLFCNGNNLSSLDVSNNINLKSLLCSSNQLTSLDVSANLNLEDLDCSDNQITALNLANNTELKQLTCTDNRLSNIDVSLNTALNTLAISNNRLTGLVTNNNVNLESLICANNQIISLDVSSNTNLKILDVSNNSISSLDLSTINTVTCPDPQTNPVTICQGASSINVSNNQLIVLTVANGFNDLVSTFNSESNPNLFCVQVDAGFSPNSNWAKDDWTYFGETTCTDIYTYIPDDSFEQVLISLGLDDDLDHLVLTSNISSVLALDVSNASPNIEDLTGIEDFTALQTLNCSTNNINEIDLSNNTALTNFNGSANGLTHLDLSNNSGLTVLDVSNNALVNLDLSNNLSITNLNCSNNTIQSLNLSNHPIITDFNCESNALTFLNIKNGQNGSLANFSTLNNMNLSCIETDTGTVPGGVTWIKDVTTSYAITCGTYIPDNAFEQELIDQNIDSDGVLNNFVPTADINTLLTLDLSNATGNISDLTGIQDFIALEVLNCSNNTIKELNLTANTALTSINCSNNILEFVDIRNGTNNSQLVTFIATNNPNLYCINVDDPNYSRNAAGWQEDVTASYAFDCENDRYTSIPDDNFEQALIDLGIDSGPLDNQVLTANIEYLTSLNVSGKNIESLVGIKAFLSLTELDCSNNDLDELDVSGMVNLENLFCGSNYFLTNIAGANGALNTTGTPSLTKLICADNNLADIDISLHTNLEILDCSNNSLATLNISNNNNLIEVNCDNNQISNFISYIADNATLTLLSCNNNELSALQVNRCLTLNTLNCRSNTLNVLDISSNGALEILDFSDNALTDVNLSANTNLLVLSGAQNQLTEVDDLSSTVLENLVLDNNQISQLSTVLSGLSSIKYLSISNNQLSDLDTSFNTNLIELNVSNNTLSSLLLPTNLNQLKTFNCSNNSITGDFNLTGMGIGLCPAQNLNNPLDFCPDTITINVSGNQLEFVNIQNGINSEISNFSATNNPNLTCIQVDDVNNIGINWIKGSTAEYSEDCRFGETYVPDDNFEQALITLGYDTGVLDDYVPTANIEVLTTLNVSGNNISDLTGIEDFTALQILNCSNNALNTIDISSNANLIEVNCSNNSIESIDFSNNSNLINVNIANNVFTEFTASLILTLEIFNCDSNNIAELDFTSNTALSSLSCVSNTLEILNLQNGQNSSLLNLNAQSNPDLTCIQTDNGSAPGGVTWLKDAITQYAIDCHFGETYVPDDNFEQALIDLGYDVAPLNDYVPTSNIQHRIFLDVSGKNISDLTGIEDFENLTSLNFKNNTVADVDLSSNLKLISIIASANQLTNLDISNQSDLRVLNISENGFTQIDFSNNLGLTELNISGNDFNALDVSVLTGLNKLNCSSNQLTELDVTQNPNLIELFCQSNVFIQDKLNLKNGANASLQRFNATNNPDLSCILVDDPIAVISNTNGTYNAWFKDATANYQTICDDADNDGVANTNDQCPGTPLGEPVDLFGCPILSLPNDNFTILITGETCLNNNDGKVNITTKEFYNYKVNLAKEGFNRDYNFTNEIEIRNLLAGTYKLCITVEEFPNFQRCFDVVINHPENLEVITGKSSNGKEVTFSMSGNSNYNIDFNGLKYTTNSSEITLQLEQGKNSIKISTDLKCQGVYEETILLSNAMFVYPNPFQNDVNIYLGNVEGNIDITMYSYLGQLVYSKTILSETSRSFKINANALAAGLYTVFIRSNASVSTFKIVKK